MAAKTVEIAEAVLDVLNDATLSQSFTATRAYVPVFGKQDEEGEAYDNLGELSVVVVPRELSNVPLTRGSSMFDYIIDIGVNKRIPPDNASADEMMLLVEEIVDLFRGKALDGYEEAKCSTAANVPIYSFANLDELRAFTSVISLTFQMQRAIT